MDGEDVFQSRTSLLSASVLDVLVDMFREGKRVYLRMGVCGIAMLELGIGPAASTQRHPLANHNSSLGHDHEHT